MASRSFKPASYLASAAQGQKSAPRPSFTRTSSSSSTKSDDLLIGPLKALNIIDKENKKGHGKENTGSRSPRTPGGTSLSASTSISFLDDTPGRKRSQPIAIELPGRDPRAVYTPLSARGDLPGGYFPNHEEITRSYKSHPFSSHHKRDPSSDLDSPSEMPGSALGSPISDTTPRGPSSIPTPAFATEALTMPMGKYHPSNYKSAPNTAVSTPPGLNNITAPFPSTNLAIPKTTGKRKTAGRPVHERRTSDVKRKIQQYQRDMIAQARFANVSGSTALKTMVKEPSSPRLLPAGSPGPITPFELEESAGYLVAGSRGEGSLIGTGLDREEEEQLEIVDRIIRTEEERRGVTGTGASARV